MTMMTYRQAMLTYDQRQALYSSFFNRPKITPFFFSSRMSMDFDGDDGDKFPYNYFINRFVNNVTSLTEPEIVCLKNSKISPTAEVYVCMILLKNLKVTSRLWTNGYKFGLDPSKLLWSAQQVSNKWCKISDFGARSLCNRTLDTVLERTRLIESVYYSSRSGHPKMEVNFTQKLARNQRRKRNRRMFNQYRYLPLSLITLIVFYANGPFVPIEL